MVYYKKQSGLNYTKMRLFPHETDYFSIDSKIQMTTQSSFNEINFLLKIDFLKTINK